jgi:nitroreductase
MKYNLSEINDLIRDRRTIYPEQFSERKVHKEIIEVMIENARWAPTHKITQPWYFVVFMGDGLKTLSDFHSETYKRITAAENFGEKKYMFLKERPLKSSAVIAACLKRDPKESVPLVEEIAAASCAIQNMFLTATAYGLAFYWGSGGLTYHDEMKKFLGLQENDMCLGLLHIGYPAIEWPAKTKRKMRDEYTQWIME